MSTYYRFQCSCAHETAEAAQRAAVLVITSVLDAGVIAISQEADAMRRLLLVDRAPVPS